MSSMFLVTEACWLGSRLSTDGLSELASCPESEEKLTVKAALVAVVEDDKSVRKSLVRLLKSAGCRVEAFESAEEFLHARNCKQTACLVVDIGLSGMSGLDLQNSLAAEHSQLPIVFVTAHDDPEEKAHALGAGALAFLHKPVSEKELLDAVQSALKWTRKEDCRPL